MEISSGVSMEFGKQFKISATETTTELMAKLRLLLLPLRPPFPQVEELHSMDQWLGQGGCLAANLSEAELYFCLWSGPRVILVRLSFLRQDIKSHQK